LPWLLPEVAGLEIRVPKTGSVREFFAEKCSNNNHPICPASAWDSRPFYTDVHHDATRCIGALIVEEPSVAPGLRSYIANTGLNYSVEFALPLSQRTSKTL
jgi:hypothetical protein